MPAIAAEARCHSGVWNADRRDLQDLCPSKSSRGLPPFGLVQGSLGRSNWLSKQPSSLRCLTVSGRGRARPLGHKIGNQVQRGYLRTDFLDQLVRCNNVFNGGEIKIKKL